MWVTTARERGLDEFDSKRASNATFEDLVFFERQAYLNMAGRGTSIRSVGSTQRFERLSDRTETPHPDTHLRTMKQIATPDDQTTLDEYENGRQPTDWQRIRDEVLDLFHRGIEVLLDEVRDNGGLREPAIAAIDITPWQVYASPYKDDEDVTYGDESVMVNGEERYPREDYPEMVHGLPRKHERGYTMATITIIGDDTPIVLGIEPVRGFTVGNGGNRENLTGRSRRTVIGAGHPACGYPQSVLRWWIRREGRSGRHRPS